jgi:glycosyltransferase involved in cell wall biosynthesis
MKILFLSRQSSAVQYYRQVIPARICQRLGHDVTYWESGTYFDNLIPQHKTRPRHEWVEQWLIEHLYKYDLLFVDRAVTYPDWGYFSGYRHNSPPCRMIVDSDDDFFNVPKWNSAHEKYKPGQECLEAGILHLRTSECLTVTTDTLGAALAKHTHRVRVIPNLIDPIDWLGFPIDPERASDPHLRILYGGAAGHYGDLNAIREGLEAVIRNPPVPLRLLCFGALPDWMYALSREFPSRIVRLPWVPFADYPAVIAWGGFDLAIAPLADTPFARCKSNIKWVESAAQNIPLLCSDIGPYSKDIPDGCAVKVSNTPVQWAEALRHLLTDSALRSRVRSRAHEAVLSEWTIDSGLSRMQILLEEAMSWPRLMSAEDMALPASSPETLASSAGGTAETT